MIFFQKYLDKPTNHKGTFLFLTGKPIGYHRVGLLYKIWKNALIDHCYYSFFGNTDEFREACYPFIDIADRQRFFAEIKNQSPDSIEVEHTGPVSIHYLGIPYQTFLYEYTQFSVVSETHGWRGPPYNVTEKTWRAILNCHPFILAGQPGMVDYLESMGFNCYRSFLKIDYLYDSNEWTHDDNQQLIANINHWLGMTEEEWTELQKIAIKNQSIFFTYLQKNKDVFEKILTTINDVKIKNSILANRW